MSPRSFELIKREGPLREVLALDLKREYELKARISNCDWLTVVAVVAEAKSIIKS